MQNRKINNWYIALIAILFLTLITLSFFMRNSPQIGFSYVGEETYDHLLSIEKNSSLSIYETIMNFFLDMGKQDTVILLYNLLLALLFFILFFILAKQFTKSSNEIYAILLIVTLSTPVILLFTGLREISFIVVQLLFLLYVYIESESEHKYTYSQRILLFSFSILLLLFIFFQNFFLGIFISLFLLLYVFVKELKTKHSLKSSMIEKKVLIIQKRLSLFTFFAIIMYVLLSSSFSTIFDSFYALSLDASFVFFGATIAYSLFVFILGIGGAIITKRISSTISKLFILLALCLSLFNKVFLVIGVLLFSFYSGIAFINLFEKKWLISYLRVLTIILFVCMFLFSTLIGFRSIPFEEPSNIQINALERINILSKDQNCVTLSQDISETYIHYFSKTSSYEPILFENENLSLQKIFSLQQYTKIQDIFNKTNVCFIHIDDMSKSKTQLDRPSEGLELVIKYSGAFTPVYNEYGQRIYRYNP